MWCLFRIHITNVFALAVLSFVLDFSAECFQLVTNSLSLFLNLFNRHYLIGTVKCSGSLIMLYSHQRIIPRLYSWSSCVLLFSQCFVYPHPQPHRLELPVYLNPCLTVTPCLKVIYLLLSSLYALFRDSDSRVTFWFTIPACPLSAFVCFWFWFLFTAPRPRPWISLTVLWTLWSLVTTPACILDCLMPLAYVLMKLWLLAMTLFGIKDHV